MASYNFNRRLRVSNNAQSNNGNPKAWDPDAGTSGTGTGSGGTSKPSTKTMVFNVPSVVSEGLQASPTKSPVSGTITDISASLNTPGTSDTIYDIQTCTETSFNSSTRVWTSILSHSCTITANSSSAKGILKTSNIASGTYVRLIVLNSPVDASGLVVEVSIEVV